MLLWRMLLRHVLLRRVLSRRVLSRWGLWCGSRSGMLDTLNGRLFSHFIQLVLVVVPQVRCTAPSL